MLLRVAHPPRVGGRYRLHDNVSGPLHELHGHPRNYESSNKPMPPGTCSAMIIPTEEANEFNELRLLCDTAVSRNSLCLLVPSSRQVRFDLLQKLTIVHNVF